MGIIKGIYIYVAFILCILCLWKFYKSPLEILIFSVFFCVLTFIAYSDIKNKKIGNISCIIILLISVISYYAITEISVYSRMFGFICVSLPMLIIACMVPGAFGGGDIKLMAVCGAFLGYKMIVAATMIAFLTGGLWSIIMLAKNKKALHDSFAFGPFLCAGMVLVVLFDEQILRFTV